MPFLVDSFTDTNGTLLHEHSPDTGGTWQRFDWRMPDGVAASNQNTIQSDRLQSVTAARGYRNSTSPGSAEYTVKADFNFGTANKNSQHTSLVLAARMTPTDTAHADVDRYWAGWWGESSHRDWSVNKVVSGIVTKLDGGGSQPDDNTTYPVRFEVSDSAKALYVDDVQIVSTVDNDITHNGEVGLSCAINTGDGWIDNLEATAAGADDPANLAVVIDGTTAQLSWDPSPLLT